MLHVRSPVARTAHLRTPCPGRPPGRPFAPSQLRDVSRFAVEACTTDVFSPVLAFVSSGCAAYLLLRVWTLELQAGDTRAGLPTKRMGPDGGQRKATAASATPSDEIQLLKAQLEMQREQAATDVGLLEARVASLASDFETLSAEYATLLEDTTLQQTRQRAATPVGVGGTSSSASSSVVYRFTGASFAEMRSSSSEQARAQTDDKRFGSIRDGSDDESHSTSVSARNPLEYDDD